MALQLIHQPHKVIYCDKGSIAAPNKKCRQWDVRQVLPIDGIFAECSTRHPSNYKLCRGANKGLSYEFICVPICLYINSL